MSAEREGIGLGTVILSAVIGAAVGAAVALLLAPKAGSELRVELGEKAKETSEKLREAAARARERAEELAAAAREHMEEGCRSEQAASAPTEPEPEGVQA